MARRLEDISGTAKAVVVADGDEAIMGEAQEAFAEGAPGFDGEGTPWLLAELGRVGQGRALEMLNGAQLAVVVQF